MVFIMKVMRIYGKMNFKQIKSYVLNNKLNGLLSEENLGISVKKSIKGKI